MGGLSLPRVLSVDGARVGFHRASASDLRFVLGGPECGLVVVPSILVLRLIGQWAEARSGCAMHLSVDCIFLSRLWCTPLVCDVNLDDSHVFLVCMDLRSHSLVFSPHSAGALFPGPVGRRDG